MYHYIDSGLKNVWLASGYALRMTPDGKSVAIYDLDGLGVAICLALTKKPAPLTGEELRYIRNTGLMQLRAGLAKLLGNNEPAVVRWEKSGKVPRWADKLVRLLYLTHVDGKASIASVVERIDVIDRPEMQKIVLKRARSGWVSSIELQTYGTVVRYDNPPDPVAEDDCETTG